MTTTLNVNGETHNLDAPPDMPLLWVLRDLVGLTGTKFGCGIAQCGACTVHLDGAAVRSCVLPVAAVGDRKITTIEAVGNTPAGQESAGRVEGARRRAVRLLPVGPGDVGGVADREQPKPERRRHRRRDGRQHLPLRHVQPHPRGDQARREGSVTCRRDCSMRKTATRPKGGSDAPHVPQVRRDGRAQRRAAACCSASACRPQARVRSADAKSVIGGDGDETPQGGVFAAERIRPDRHARARSRS